MKKQIVVTTEQLQHVLTDLQNLVTEHPSEEELTDYAFGDLTADEQQGLETHLADCGECREQIAALRQSAEPWQGAAGEQRLANLRQRLLDTAIPKTPAAAAASPLAKLAEQLRRVLLSFKNLSVPGDLQVAYAKTPPPEPEGFQTEDGSLRGLMVYDEQGNLNITFSSRVLAEGVKLRLRSSGEWRRGVILTRKTADQVGAKISISGAEIADKKNKLDRAVRIEVDEE